MKPCCKSMAAGGCRAAAAAAAALALIGGLVFLAGVGTLHTSCWDAEAPVDERIALYMAANLSVSASCAKTLGWPWLVVFANLAACAFAAFALLHARGAPARLSALALVALSTSWVSPLCNSFLMMLYNASDEWGMLMSGAACAVAGTLIASVANIILCLALGWTHPGSPAPTACCRKPAGAACPATDATPAPTLAVTADAAFIKKSEQAAAAGMV